MSWTPSLVTALLCAHSARPDPRLPSPTPRSGQVLRVRPFTWMSDIATNMAAPELFSQLTRLTLTRVPRLSRNGYYSPSCLRQNPQLSTDSSLVPASDTHPSRPVFNFHGHCFLGNTAVSQPCSCSLFRHISRVCSQLNSGQTPVLDGRVSRHRQAWGIFRKFLNGPSSDLQPRLHIRKRF